MKRLMLLCGLVALFAVPAASALSQSLQVNPSAPAFGQSVTFSYANSPGRTLSIAMQCYPATGGEVDYDQPAASAFVLTGWDASSATCYATLYYLQGTRQHLVSSTSFAVAGS